MSAAALSVDCASAEGGLAEANAEAGIRQPALGQSWRYAKHDFFTGAQVDTLTETISAVGQTIDVASHSEIARDEPIIYPSWGSAWQARYISGLSRIARLPAEIHSQWGSVLIDPHWSQLQVYQNPIPLWPVQLRPGWSTTVGTYYKIPESHETMPWQLTMHAQKWELTTVPAGQFRTLRYFNLINFRYTNVSGRVAGQRKETVWFAPQVGRWVKRESSGTFRQDVAEDFNESSYRWELLSWT
jgi:hypothetical protein